MKFLKNNLKVIIAFILGLILAGGIVYAATSASQVSYIRTGTNIETVEQALNDLYTKKTIENLQLIRDLSSDNYLNRATTITTSFNDGEANKEYYLIGKYIFNGSGATIQTLSISSNSIANKINFDNAIILEEYPDLDMIKIKAINNGTISMTMTTGVSDDAYYRGRLFLKIYK